MSQLELQVYTYLLIHKNARENKKKQSNITDLPLSVIQLFGAHSKD
jgi:hypothetical protein